MRALPKCFWGMWISSFAKVQLFRQMLHVSLTNRLVSAEQATAKPNQSLDSVWCKYCELSPRICKANGSLRHSLRRGMNFFSPWECQSLSFKYSSKEVTLEVTIEVTPKYFFSEEMLKALYRFPQERKAVRELMELRSVSLWFRHRITHFGCSCRAECQCLVRHF